MKTIILCGGHGTRIRDVSEGIPKPMVPVGGHPILWHIMKIYSYHGFNEFILCLGYKAEMIKDFFLNYYSRVHDVTIDLSKPNSIIYEHARHKEDWKVTLAETGENAMTGARVKRVLKYVDGDTFMLTYGDGVANIDLRSLVAFHQSHRCLVTVTGVRPPGRFGEIEVDESGETVTAFAEKPQTGGGLINGGFFVMQRSFLEQYLPDDDPGCILEHEPLMRCAADGQLKVYVHNDYWQPMDTPREYQLLNALWEQGRAPWRIWDETMEGDVCT